MKFNIKYLLLGGVLAGMCSCTDLDIDVNTRYTSFPDNPIATEGEFSACYKYMHGWFGRDYIEGVVYQGDELMGCCYTIGNYWDDGRYFNGSAHCLHLDDWRSNIMDGCLSGCTYTNTRIAAYGGAEFKDPVVAPLRAIRAYYTFWMMDLYGDCPIMDHVLDEGEVIQRQPRANVAKWIESELLDILGQEGGLSKANDASTYGRPNYWMAAALLAKLYLNWGVYTHDITTVNNETPNEKLNDCVAWCDEIIKSNIFEVGKGYRKKFFPDNGVHIKDFIYALDVDPDGKGDGCGTWYRWCGLKKYGLTRPFQLGYEIGTSLAGNQVLTPEALARFTLQGDERNDIVLSGPQFVFDANYNKTDEPVYLYKDPEKPNTLIGQLNFRGDFDFDDAEIYSLGDESLPAVNKTSIANGTAFLNMQKGARLFKFPPRDVDFSLYGRNQANDYPIFRFADILLTKAECILRGATATMGHTPMSLFNEIRRCSSAPEMTVAPSFQDILDERSREFIAEPWRRNDLIRFGQFENDWGQKNKYKKWTNDAHTDFVWVEREGVKDPNRRLMPLYRGKLETNLNWKQNPGYQGL